MNIYIEKDKAEERGGNTSDLLGGISYISDFYIVWPHFSQFFHSLPVSYPLREHTSAVFMLILCSLSCVCYSKQLKQLLPVILFLWEPQGRRGLKIRPADRGKAVTACW